jgi:hypothetical protein
MNLVVIIIVLDFFFFFLMVMAGWLDTGKAIWRSELPSFIGRMLAPTPTIFLVLSLTVEVLVLC